MNHMSLPISKLRERLRELIKFKKRGYMATLSELSGVPDGTIHRIAYGKQKTVTYKIWKQLHDVAPELPPPPLSVDYDMSEEAHLDPEKRCFIAALQHYYPIDEKFNTLEDLALSVGLREKDVRGILTGDYSCMPNDQQMKVIAHAFGMSLDDFMAAGRRILEKNKEDTQVADLEATYGFESATTRQPEIVQIVKMAEKLDDEKIHILKELTLKLLISHMEKK